MTTQSSTPEPLIWTPEPSYVPGAWFDESAVERVLKFFEVLRHIKGRRWAGQPLTPDDWQIEWLIRPVFGWKHPDGRRIIRTVWLEVPRKNGKSTLASGLALYMLCADREPGAEVYAAAWEKEQARQVFGPAVAMVEASKPLKKRLKPMANTITFPKTNSFFRVLSKEFRSKHGFNVHGAVIDEVHVHQTRDQIDALEGGTASREQPLIFFITTAGEEGEGSIYAEKHDYARQVAKGLVQDPTFYAVIYAAEKEDDWTQEEVWAKANPGLGKTVQRDYLASKVALAQARPSSLNTLLRLHFNIRTKTTSSWMDLAKWDASAGLVKEEKLRGRECYAGLDVATSTEVVSLCLHFPGEEHEVLWRFWLPEERLLALDEQTAGAASGWVKDGWLKTTPGDVIDYEAILAQIDKDAETFEILELAYHRWGMAQLSVQLQEQGMEVVPVTQTVTALSPGTKELERLVLSEKYRHSGNPIMRWMIDGTVTKSNANGDIKPDKAASKVNITGVIAAVMALDRAVRTAGEDSETPDISWM